MTHKFKGKWITDGTFSELEPRNVFHRQLEPIDLPQTGHENSHLLFRRSFDLSEKPREAKIYITADDYYRLYVNGHFVGSGPAPSYHVAYNYNELDVTEYLREGENLIAVHTYYQGLINRVWQSGDLRHGLLLDLLCDGKTALASDEGFRCRRHGGFSECGRSGYDTQFMERYDSRAREVGFELPDFDDSGWESAGIRKHTDYTLVPQKTSTLVYESISPIIVEQREDRIFIDFGKSYVGNLRAKARGKDGQTVRLAFGAELCEDGSVRSTLRCNCSYLEEWVLSGGEDELYQFDTKAFRYAEIFADGAEIFDISLSARHYPFELRTRLAPAYADDEWARRIWELCVHTHKYGVQETIQDCTDREKGFYLGDGCYTALANYLLTGDDSMVRKLIDDAFVSSFITEGLVTCLDCSMMQEIAEFPLILPDLMLWHYRIGGDSEYLAANLPRMISVLEFYKRSYERNHLLRDLDRWCVVEWPKNYRDGYAVDVTEGQVCHEAHISINAYYYRAIDSVNQMQRLLGKQPYRDTAPIRRAIIDTFYDAESGLFSDGEEHRHVSLPGNVFPYAFGIHPREDYEERFLRLLDEKGEDSTFLFTSFPLLFKFSGEGMLDRLDRLILHKETWRRMLREGATATFEGWGKDCKWNTSLFHLTMSAVAIFLSDIDLGGLFFRDMPTI